MIPLSNGFGWLLVCLAVTLAGGGLVPPASGATDDLAALWERSEKLAEEGHYMAAMTLTIQVLERVEKENGAEHPATASLLNNLGRLYQAMGDYAKAETLLQRALKTTEKVLGPEHRCTAISCNNLGLLFGLARGRYFAKFPSNDGSEP